MAQVPDFRELDNNLFRKVLEGHRVHPGEFAQMTPPQKDGVWADAWATYQEFLDAEFEPPTSASAKFEKDAAKEKRRSIADELMPDDAPEESPSVRKPADNEPLDRLLTRRSSRADSDELGIATSGQPCSRGDEIDIDDLFDQWVEANESSLKSPPEIEQLWPDLPSKTLAELEQRIARQALISPFFNTVADSLEDTRIDLAVLTKGYRPFPGQTWELVERLDNGRSGFGVVWKAWNPRLKRSATFKFCKRPLETTSLMSLHNEVHLVTTLDHPGIVKLFDEALEAEIPFVVYEYVEGVTLARSLETVAPVLPPLGKFAKSGAGRDLHRFTRNRFQPLSPVEAAGVILKLATIVAAAHSKKVVHRDLKPQNILVVNHKNLQLVQSTGVVPDLRFAELKVIDFGIGALSESQTDSMGRLFDCFGTAPYASPQQRQRKTPDRSDDVYAIGVIWQQLLLGKLSSELANEKWSIRLTASLLPIYRLRRTPLMLLRAQPIGQPPSRRWVIQDIKKNTVWDGEQFATGWVSGRKYAHPSDACADMAQILKGFYGKLEKRTFVVPIEVEVFGSATPNKVARYLYNASILNIQTHEHGNGPCECLVLPTIHWGKIREVHGSAVSSGSQDLIEQSPAEESDENQ